MLWPAMAIPLPPQGFRADLGVPNPGILRDLVVRGLLPDEGQADKHTLILPPMMWIDGQVFPPQSPKGGHIMWLGPEH
jgi:hypothetical protein